MKCIRRFQACAACHASTPVDDLVPHYRGTTNSPLCPRCAQPGRQSVCEACRQPSPAALFLPDGYERRVCPCVPVCELKPRTVQPLRHEVPAGWAGTVRPLGYGLCEVELVTPAGTFVGGGYTDYGALRHANAAARSAGALQ